MQTRAVAAFFDRVRQELDEQDMRVLAECYRRCEDGAKAWEPKDPTIPFFERAIRAGYLERQDGRCMFERFKDSHVMFTPAGKAAMAAYAMQTVK